MRKLFHNCKGAVTVMVTLLLIPAILVSGTGVDLARIYTARSIVQDANQLAANSVLASYEALLQDLYGLFGVMNDGKINQEDYVKKAIEGGGWDKGMGTFQIFYGSTVDPAVLTPEPNQNLGNPVVLRRQIEEYSKLRAPAIIAELLMEKLDTFEKIQEDARVIKKKLEVDDGVEELEKYYKKIYNHIIELEDCGEQENLIMADTSNTAAKIQDKLQEMKDIKDQYREARDERREQQEIYDTTEDEEVRRAAEERMDELDELMERLELQYEGEWTLIQGISRTFHENAKKYDKKLNHYLQKLTELQDDCETAERVKIILRNKIRALRDALESGTCSKTLQEGMMLPEPNAPDGLSILERYEALLEYDIKGMGDAMYDHNYGQVFETRRTMNNARLAGILLTRYRDVNRDSFFPLDPDSTDSFPEALSASTTFKPYIMPDGKAYLRFEEIKPPQSERFWNELRQLYDNSDGKGAKKRTLDNAISKVFKKSQSVFKGLLDFHPDGAEYLSGGADESEEITGSKFGTENTWNNKDDGKDEMEDSLDGDFLEKLANMASEAGNKLLILIYDTEMFSDFSCPKEGEDGYPRENMAGIPLSKDVNYYFQSELEYLYNGNLADAVDNLKSVAGMMLLVRFVMDYVASFRVSSVNNIVSSIKSAMSWSGPFAILAGELARLGLSIGEAAVDISRLRTGQQVAVFKDDETWKLSIRGLTDAAVEELSDAALDAAFDTNQYGEGDRASEGDEGFTLSYTDYMRLFLLLVPGDTLAKRTQNLIELNVTNYRDNIRAEEAAMAKAERYDLDKVFTGFTLTTTVDMRMLFLSMPFAQEGIDGVVPPKTLPVVVSDYRGY